MKIARRVVDLFQFADQPLCLGELGKYGLVYFGKLFAIALASSINGCCCLTSL